MRSASSKKIASLGIIAALLAGSALAAPTISDWSLTTAGNEEILKLRWSEEGSCEVSEFADARNFVVVIPSARLSDTAKATLLGTNGSQLFNRVRLNQVTLPSGEKGVQLTADLREWTQYRTESTPEGYTIAFTVPAALKAQPAPQPAGFELTDDMVEHMLSGGTFGAYNAPASGAGQAPEEAAPLAQFYVPPASSPNTPSSSMDVAEMTVQNKLNERVVRVDFQGTELENVLRLIAERSELNILIKPSDVRGRLVTLRLRNVTLREMMDAILKQNGLGYTIEPGGIVNIVPRSMVKTTDKELTTETVVINWVDVREVAGALKPFVDEQDGKIEVATSSNLLIIRDVPENVRRLRELIARIDRPEKQVLIELRLVNMSETARRAIGTRTDFYDTKTADRFDIDPVTGAIAERNLSNSISNSATRSATSSNTGSDSITSSLSGISRSLTQSSNNSSNIGSSGSSSSTIGESSTVNVIPNAAGGFGLLAPGAEALTLRTLGGIGVLGARYDVSFQLNAQEERGEAVTLANPTVLSLNNVEAVVEILRQIPYQTAINSDQGSVATVAFTPVGTTVTILPRITDNGYVQMNIAPEQTIDTGARPGGVPQTDERRVSAAVIVKDEQTVAIGGLRQFESAASENGVPYLLRLPVLSWLFKNQTNSQSRTELTLFVTPQILKDPTPTTYQQALYEKIDYNWDLPDYYFDEVVPRKAPGETYPMPKRTR
jgi:type IV pilus assembly protein PilQ